MFAETTLSHFLRSVLLLYIENVFLNVDQSTNFIFIKKVWFPEGITPEDIIYNVVSTHVNIKKKIMQSKQNILSILISIYSLILIKGFFV